VLELGQVVLGVRDLEAATRRMEAEGFAVYPAEWWHFDYKNWRQYRIMDVPFEAIGK